MFIGITGIKSQCFGFEFPKTNRRHAHEVWQEWGGRNVARTGKADTRLKTLSSLHQANLLRGQEAFEVYFPRPSCHQWNSRDTRGEKGKLGFDCQSWWPRADWQTFLIQLLWNEEFKLEGSSSIKNSFHFLGGKGRDKIIKYIFLFFSTVSHVDRPLTRCVLEVGWVKREWVIRGYHSTSSVPVQHSYETWSLPSQQPPLSSSQHTCHLEFLHGHQLLAFWVHSPAHLPADTGSCQRTPTDSSFWSHRCSGASWSKVIPVPMHHCTGSPCLSCIESDVSREMKNERTWRASSTRHLEMLGKWQVTKFPSTKLRKILRNPKWKGNWKPEWEAPEVPQVLERGTGQDDFLCRKPRARVCPQGEPWHTGGRVRHETST